MIRRSSFLFLSCFEVRPSSRDKGAGRRGHILFFSSLLLVGPSPSLPNKNTKNEKSPLLVFVFFCPVQDKAYEYVVVDSPRLASVSADGGAFDAHIASGEGQSFFVYPVSQSNALAVMHERIEPIACVVQSIFCACFGAIYPIG